MNWNIQPKKKSSNKHRNVQRLVCRFMASHKIKFISIFQIKMQVYTSFLRTICYTVIEKERNNFKTKYILHYDI